MTEPIKPGEPSGIPTPGQATPPAPGAGQIPATPVVPGQVQTPPEGANPQVPSTTTVPTVPVPLDRKGLTPTPGDTSGGSTVPLKALQDEREKRQALQSELEQMRVQQTQQQGNATAYPQQPQVNQQQPIDQDRVRLDKLWETDPREAVRAEINNSLVYYDNVNAQVESQANFLSSKYQDFSSYRTQAMNYIRTLPYDQRAQEGIVELAYMVARGQNVDTLMQTKEQELMDKFKSGQFAGSLNQPAGAGGQPMTPAGVVMLTPEQQQAAAAMGLTEADYASNMSRSA